MKKWITSLLVLSVFLGNPGALLAVEGEETFLVHLQSSLKKDDAKICVAYNIMWAALREGYHVKVLIDADAVTTYKVGWRGKDDIEKYKIPENLRQALSEQFEVVIDTVPKTYGEFLLMLKDEGVEFYVNAGFLIVSKIGEPGDLLKNVSAKYFTPVSLTEMVRLRAEADVYMTY